MLLDKWTLKDQISRGTEWEVGQEQSWCGWSKGHLRDISVTMWNPNQILSQKEKSAIRNILKKGENLVFSAVCMVFYK